MAITIKQLLDIAFTFESVSDADVTIPAFTVTASLQNGSFANVTIPAMTIEAGGAGGVDITIPAFTIEAALVNATTADVTFAAFTMEATGLVGSVSNLDEVTGSFTITATASGPNILTGNAIFPAFTIFGSSGNQHNTDGRLPSFTMEATGRAGSLSNVDSFFSAFTIEASTGHSGGVTIPAFIIQATGSTGAVVNVDRPFPAFTIEASSTLGIVGRTDAAFPAFTMEAQGRQTNQLNTGATFPAFTVQGKHVQGQLMSAAVSMAAFTMTAAGFSPNNGDVDATIAAFTIDATGHITIDNYLKTIALNLRNLGNTEYINYPFNSMAYIGDVPIGVNSTGLYSLDGADDAGVNIDGKLRFGYYDTQNELFEKLINCYVSSKTNDDLVVELVSEDGATRSYPIAFFQDKFITRRRKFPRDMRDRYYSLRIKNVNGGELEFHKVDLETILAKEKI